LSVHLSQGTADNGKILGESVNQSSVYLTVTGNHAFTGYLLLLHSEVNAPVLDESIHLYESPFVKQKRQPLSGGQFPFFVLFLDSGLSPPEHNFFLPLAEILVFIYIHDLPFFSTGV